MKTPLKVALVVLSTAVAVPAQAERPCGAKKSDDLAWAPPPFTLPPGRCPGAHHCSAVPADFEWVEVAYSIVHDAKKQSAVAKVTATATVCFTVRDAGLPILDLRADVKKLRLDGRISSLPGEFPSVRPRTPTGTIISDVRPFRVLGGAVVKPGEAHRLVVDYEIDAVSTAQGIDLAFEMVDVFGCKGANCVDRNDTSLVESYFPGNFEFDRFQATVSIDLVSSKTHSVFANGHIAAQKKRRAQHWTIRYPSDFNSASFYLHLTSNKIERTWRGPLGAPLVRVYGEGVPNVEKVLRRTRAAVNSLSFLGPYPHDELLVRVRPGMNGGQEYAGAVALRPSLTPRLVRHEVGHMYFARHRRPATGCDLWIDEAIATRLESLSVIGGYSCATAKDVIGPSGYARAVSNDAYLTGLNFLVGVDDCWKQSATNVRGMLGELAQEGLDFLTKERFWRAIEQRSTVSELACIRDVATKCLGRQLIDRTRNACP